MKLKKKSTSVLIAEIVNTIVDNEAFNLTRSLKKIQNKNSNTGLNASGPEQLKIFNTKKRYVEKFLDQILILVINAIHTGKIQDFNIDDLERSLKNSVTDFFSKASQWSPEKLTISEEKITAILLFKISKFESDYFDKLMLKKANLRAIIAGWASLATLIISIVGPIVGLKH